jgi:protein-ribulosamine 3-kinase
MNSVMSAEAIAAIEEIVGARFRGGRPQSGGSISQAFVCEMENGQRVFVKIQPGDFLEAFAAEAAGLSAIANVKAITVPRVYGIAKQREAFSVIVMEAIECTSPNDDFFKLFGRQLAEFHRQSQYIKCGWETDNFIGSTKQPNSWNADWIEFFRENRLGYQLRQLRHRGLGSQLLRDKIVNLQVKLDVFLAGSAESPVLLHGDLWSGNFLCNKQRSPVLVDPAVYYGHREAEFGMLLLFGNCPESFYESYQSVWPLAEGWRRRAEVYRLYHLLNHLNLFGGSYLSDCMNSLRVLEKD